MSLPVPTAPRASASLALAFALALAGAAEAGPRQPAPFGSASLELGAEDLSARLGLPLGAEGGCGLRLDADEEAARARAFLELVGDGRSELALGPGAPSGILRFLLDPASAAALSPGPPVSIDRSMETGRAALRIAAGGLCAFAIGESEGPLLSFRRSSLAAADDADGADRPPAAAASGISFGVAGEEGGWSVAADASSRDGGEGGGGWSPDPRPDRGGTMAHLALAARRSSAGLTAAAAVAASAGRLDGTGLAARVQALGAAGPISLNVSIGAAGAAYRGLFGAPPAEAFRCRAELALRLRRASRVSASTEAWAEREGRLSSPAWGSEGSASASVALGEGLSCAIAGTLKRDPGEADEGGGAGGGLSSAALTASISRSSVGRGAAKSRLAASLRWKRGDSGVAMDGIDLSADLAVDGGEAWPSASIRLKALLPASGGAVLAPVARGGIGLDFPLGAARELTIRFDLPSEGVRLAPLGREEEAEEFAFSIGYRASLPLR